MTGNQLAKYRKQSKQTQERAARALGVSQTYLSLLENGKRPVTERLKKRAVKVFGLPPTKVPARSERSQVQPVSDDRLAADLSALGYMGFSHLRPSRRRNPADVLLSALNSPKRDARLVEALPWVVLAYPDMEWNSLVKTAKAYDLQNRLGFVTNVARRLAELRGDRETAAKLKSRERDLERSLLAREDTMCNETMTNAERKWLNTNRSEAAKHWRVLTSLTPKLVRYA